jgi:hypothetical protein
VRPLDRDTDVVFLGHELFTFYGGEEKTVSEEVGGRLRVPGQAHL